MVQKEIINGDGSKTIIITSTYSESQKRATKKYRENNKEKVNEQRKQYYIKRKEKDPNFLLYKRTKAKEYYNKKKALKPIIEEIKEEIKEEEIKVPIIEEIPVIDETIVEKKKRKYTKRTKST